MRDHNRIDHVVWAVEPDNLTGYAERLAQLLDTEFEEFTGVPGLRVFVSWDSGFEVAAPGNGEGPAGDAVRGFLARKGEGIFAVVHRVPDLEVAAARAKELGWPVGDRVAGAPATDQLWKRITRLREQAVGPFANTSLFFGEIDYQD
ncbi:hypothetical protein [Cryptosporangium sp. NPDC051539]|uniref:hypothetical protein n=1 Tax=Cryptosporangium sp. NPDC051539 TaxID=3363962 RepID=UPI0037B3AFC0